ncbi:Metallo-dependent phosphatase-like protein [Hypoxylon rubiginosum]|uniref:Metallo-dependent phosphatase-like protein n=1 Tax=Hypoxylon rubiginosum TaxID=110542 RepID=A0ACC0D999_9PEZI|nr:Metallo-dependent phosphatase-like protein [Hypoxylon rubiginosum]
MASTGIATRFLVISDTHVKEIPRGACELPVDVAIHCGNFTEESGIDEYRTALEQLREITALLKLVVPGNCDWTMDVPTFRENVGRVSHRVDAAAVRKEYGEYGEAVELFLDAKAEGIQLLLVEGTYKFKLDNGALLSVYASPFTPSDFDTMGFQYFSGDHSFDIPTNVDVVITHGPPHGILDMVAERRRGCPKLLRAIARAQPKLHCFGHIYDGWGAKLVTWRKENEDDDSASGSTPIVNNNKSRIIENISTLTTITDFDTLNMVYAKLDKLDQLDTRGYIYTGHCAVDKKPLKPNQTLFVNAAVDGTGDTVVETQLPWIVDIDLPLIPTNTNVLPTSEPTPEQTPEQTPEATPRQAPRDTATVSLPTPEATPEPTPRHGDEEATAFLPPVRIPATMQQLRSVFTSTRRPRRWSTAF